MSRRPALLPEQLTIAWQSVSLLLDYPDEELFDQLELIRSASHRLPPDDRRLDPRIRGPRGGDGTA